MPKRIRLRAVTIEEKEAVERLAKSRTEAIRLVQRARIIQLMLNEPTLNASEAGLRAGFKSNAVGPVWVKRFNEAGLAGLQDEVRPGRPAQHDQAVRSKLISLALQKPCSWHTRLSCGPWNGSRRRWKSGKASTCLTQPFGPGWLKKAYNGNGSKVGSTTLNSTTLSSWKKGGHHPGLPGSARSNSSDLYR